MKRIERFFSALASAVDSGVTAGTSDRLRGAGRPAGSGA